MGKTQSACGIAVAAAAALSLAACKIERTVVAKAPPSANSVFIEDASFDPDATVAEDWDAKVLPALRAKAGLYDEVIAGIAGDPDAARQRYGFRGQQEGSAWTYAVRVEGIVSAANTESRAATIDVGTEGGHTATLQIGPVVRGTAIRDSATFRPFGSFKNQVDYAQYGRALSGRANATALSKLPRDDIVGRRIHALGVMQLDAANASALVTPVEITAEPRT